MVFKKPVSLTEHPKVNEWLTCVESEMRPTLATLLATAVTDVQQFNSEAIDAGQYMKWDDSYQVRSNILSILVVTVEPVNATIVGLKILVVIMRSSH